MDPAGAGRKTALLLALLMALLVMSAPAGTPSSALSSAADLDLYPWVYARAPAGARADDGVRVILVGDVLLGRGVNPAGDPLGAVAGWLASADLTVGNLEGFITADGGGGTPAGGGPGEPIYLPMPATAVATLRRAGFDLVGLANNHSLDGGEAGLRETVARLEAGGLAAVGLAGHDPLIREVRGVRLAFLAFNAIPPAPVQPLALEPQFWDAAGAVAAVVAARAQADAVIVLLHWGYEDEPRPDPAQVRMGQSLLAAGADLVVGHHPHVVQPVVADGGGVVAYSLGNFVFDQPHEGLALLAEFDGAGLRGVQLLPVQAGVRPRLLSPAEAEPLLARVLPPPRRLGFACDGAGCVPSERPAGGVSGRFSSGQIDLTGDGVPEVVQLVGEGVTVYAGGEAVWRSPAGWRVVDVALGDPNDDGRYEMMLAIWRADGAGYERSQPYMVGYRGGRYDLMWGGRPVGDPIQELALGDVDGDGIEELMVIEELADGSAQAVSVWQWQGWTFGLQWRSVVGCYQDLVFAAGAFAVAACR